MYGLGAAAHSCRQTTLRGLPSVLAALHGATQSAAAKKDPCVVDNAITALGKIIYHIYDGHGDGYRLDVAPASAEQLLAVHAPPRKDLVAAFLARLPLQHDEAEARVSLQLLCTWLDLGDPDIIAGGLSPLLFAMADGLLNRNVVTESLRKLISATLLGLQARPAMALALQDAWASLSGDAQAALAKVSASSS